jgi:acyl-CoA reductase-like NAD-dependent aldehyde dehydrogenase
MLKTVSPIDGQVVVERPLSTAGEVDRILENARKAQPAWAKTPLAERAERVTRAVDAFVARKDEIAREICLQMGRPLRYCPGEVNGFEERARHMIGIAQDSLDDIAIPEKKGFERYIKRAPLGVVFTVAAWNYPYLIAVNSVVPALMAGNTVVLKHSAQTPLCAERMAEAFGDLPPGVFNYMHLSHEMTAKVIEDPRVDFVAFTGSVEGGRDILRAARQRFIGVGLELGGKDPAYVRSDAPLEHTIENLADGAFFNSGQSCCGVERIYVHSSLWDPFVDGFVRLTSNYVLGNPLQPETTLGPVVRAAAADFIRGQIAEAVGAGARGLVDPARFPTARDGTPYLAPQVLVDVDHGMRVMNEETFGPVVGLMKVDSDEQAIELMNDSRYGLTASVWTSDVAAAAAVGNRIDTGTFFMNRCDYLDPALAWVGVKDSGRGCTLSSVGYEHLTRPKSFHLKVETGR